MGSMVVACNIDINDCTNRKKQNLYKQIFSCNILHHMFPMYFRFVHVHIEEYFVSFFLMYWGKEIPI